MRELPLLSVPRVTIATMTLELEHVRAIPALTGDMRPRPAAATAAASVPGLDHTDPVLMPISFAEAVASPA